LLRTAIGGLAPRPIGELAKLMKGAYGHDIGPNRDYGDAISITSSFGRPPV
jgi:hypothetical protein